ncbi:ABC-type transport auxiliary lipoprotein family protein [Ramlibacter henchirensis]|uniref:ABC-type transport auxiliary lipoprotein family protein n=1 Tax=Ramlibacter henchirensis TaxID=204072 RepID=UPI0014311D83|nr:ABC-type transport auxiliary lipoprotein family protein [Ramlibacter henchirensis]
MSLPARRGFAVRWAIASGVLALAGCLQPPNAPPQVHLAVLDAEPAQLPRGAATPDALLVHRPRARPLLDTTQMLYRPRPHEVGHFALNRWAEPPADMLHPLLVRTLERTGRFAAVLVPPPGGRPRFSLRTEIVELVQDFTVTPPVLRFALGVRLMDESSSKVLAAREIRRTQAMEQGTPAAGVAAANQAVSAALAEVAGLVLEAAAAP